LAYLKAAKEKGQHPGDWMLDRVPVLPPVFRPVSLLGGSKNQLIDDANYLYGEVWDANDNLKKLSGKTPDLGEERLALYNAFKGVTGLGDPIKPENKDQDIKGVLAHVFGSSPKFGSVQRKLLGSTVDLVGRATITPNPNLSMDQIGLPVDKAWTIYQPFVVRRLVRRGVGKVKAMEEVSQRTPAALRELQNEMQERPIIVNRAPVLHRYGIMAFWPQLTSSKTLEIPPIVTPGFGADFDGDAMQFHVPASDSAVKEAQQRLLPSKNLLNVTRFDANYLPTMEYVGGLHAASTKDNKKPPAVFKSTKDALAAYHRGEIDAGQKVEIVG
jgi:DNA-directed RNA polymerase subunit beta'